MIGRLFEALLAGLSWFSDRLTKLGGAFDGFFGRLSEGLSQLSTGDRWFSGFLRRVFIPFQWLVAPFRWLINSLDRLGGQRETPVVSHVDEEKRIKATLAKKQRETEHLAELNKSWVSRLGRWVMIPIQGFTDFFWLFVRSRPVGVLIWSLPIVAIVGVVGSVWYQTQVMDRSGLATQYEIALSNAIRAGETDQAELFRVKLEQLGMRTDRGDYRTAMALAETGDIAGAYELMKRIAPETELGFPGAHYWLAQHLIDGMVAIPQSEALRLALIHLRQVKTLMGPQPEILFLEGLTHYRLGDDLPAINSLNQITSPFPASSALLMEIHQRSGASSLARQNALALIRQLQQLANEGQSLNEDQLRWQAAAATLIGDLDSAQASVDQWYRANPNSAEAQLYRGTTSLNRFDRWLRQPDFAGVSNAVQIFRDAANLIPADRYELIWRRCMEISRLRQVNPIFVQFYEQLLTEEQLSGVVLEYFGTELAGQGNWEEADRLYARAIVAAPQWARSYNNRAYVLNSAYPERRQEALVLVNRALELDPNNPDYRETRGMIYYAQEDYTSAVADLEIAINGVNELESIHSALADSYRQLGQTDLAAVYERQLRRIRQ